ncbi:MAG: HAMP domain-containing histidine kinase [Lachnospiraceae bacterium]|nr:HAMP domain-containing histidine kinase [Lachnospiraceae bacterium]
MKTKTRTFKAKLWIYFALFTAFIFIILWLLQTVFLQGFYNSMLIADTKEAAEEILSSGTKPDVEKRIDTIARKNSLLVVVADKEGNVIYGSDEFKDKHTKKPPEDPANAVPQNPAKGTSSDQPAKKPPEDAEADTPSDPAPKNKPEDAGSTAGKSSYRTLPDDYSEILGILETKESGYAERVTEDYYVFASYIDYHGQEDRVVLYLSSPLNAVGASVSILQKILALVTVLSLAAGFVLSWFIARKFSKPVDTLCEKAEQLGENEYSSEYREGFCSELDRLNGTLDRTHEKLKVSRDFQMQLLSNVSHDLRTPLTMIKGYAEMIRDISWEDPAAMKEDIQVVIKEADRLNALVNEILEYSELQADGVRTDFEDFDLSGIVTNAAERFEQLSRPDNVVIEKNIEPGIMINGASSLIERVLYNLMDNAVRHTGDGRRISVGLVKKDGRAVLKVQDYGEGIPADEIGHIWERYYTSRQRQSKGVSGLGLAIVRQIVGMHGGTCLAESGEGKGCTFTIELKALG